MAHGSDPACQVTGSGLCPPIWCFTWGQAPLAHVRVAHVTLLLLPTAQAKPTCTAPSRAFLVWLQLALCGSAPFTSSGSSCQSRIVQQKQELLLDVGGAQQLPASCSRTRKSPPRSCSCATLASWAASARQLLPQQAGFQVPLLALLHWKVARVH